MQDDTPAKMMILCVVEIRTPNILELTDGWYSIEAHCDEALMELVGKKKIFVGVKLAISGAELISPGPTTPLEKDSGTYLKVLSINKIHFGIFVTAVIFCLDIGEFHASRTLGFEIGVLFHTVAISNQINFRPCRWRYYLARSSKCHQNISNGLHGENNRWYTRFIHFQFRRCPTIVIILGKTIFHGERQYRRISENAAMRYEHMMEKLVEDIEREEDEQDRKRTKAEGGRLNTSSNLTDEEKRSRVHAEVQKRMQANIKSVNQPTTTSF